MAEERIAEIKQNANAKDFTGQRFGKLKVIKKVGLTKSRRSVWLCQCDCGNTIELNYRSFAHWGTKSCGCQRRYIDMTGQRIGKLKVIELAGVCENYAIWRCKCDCGNEVEVRGSALRKSNPTESCGCINKEIQRARFKTHGLSRGRTYSSWHAMRERCLNQEHEAFYRYGGRGIGICDEWINDFEKFIGDMGERPKGTSLDRIDNDKGYSKDNCRWVTRKQQCRNKRDNVLLTFNGKTQCVSAWADEIGLKACTLFRRIHDGRMSTEEALTRPLRRILSK